jgi:hypothetical protein
MREEVKSFRLGVLVFSLPPGIVLMLLLLVLGAGFVAAVGALVLLAAGLQVAAHLSMKKRTRWGFFLLRGAFHSLRLVQKPLGLSDFSPERMVIGIYSASSRSDLGSVRPDPARTLVLLPHCLQNHECPHRLTFDLDSCTRCGKCTIGGLLDIRDRFGISMAVATGGTLARKIVERTDPSVILAVACPRDLSAGMLDVYPIPTMGQLNEWRAGECIDTWVDLGELERSLESLLGGPAPAGA